MPALLGLVAEVGDLLQAAVLDLLGDLLDQAAAVVAPVALRHLVGHLGDDDRLLALAQRLDVRPSAHDHAAAAGLVGVLDAAVADDDAAGREVRALDVPHQPADLDLRVVDVGDRGVDRLAQVVRRDVGRHADGDAGRAVDQQVREAGGQHDRLLARLVVVGDEVDRVHVDVPQHLRREACEPRLGVTHRGRRIVVDRAEVALRLDQRVAHREVLPEAHQRVVDGGVAVRVELAEHVADDARGLAEGAVGLQPGLVHREQHTPVHRLEAVAHVRQRAAHDHAHGVVEVRGAHLLLEPARLDVAAGELVDRHSVHL